MTRFSRGPFLRFHVTSMGNHVVDHLIFAMGIPMQVTHWGWDKMADILQTFQTCFLEWNVWISIKSSLKFVAKVPIDKMSALVSVRAWHWTGDKPLCTWINYGPAMLHICLSWSQWGWKASLSRNRPQFFWQTHPCFNSLVPGNNVSHLNKRILSSVNDYNSKHIKKI